MAREPSIYTLSMHVTNLLKQRHKLLGEDVGAQGVCGKVFLQSLLCHLPGVDHASGIVDQHVQLCVLAAEIVNKLKSNETGFKNCSGLFLLPVEHRS